MSTTIQDPRVGDAALQSPGLSAPRPVNPPDLVQPASVAKALEAHRRVVDEYAETRQAITRADKTLTEAKAADIRTDAEAIAANKKPVAPEKREEPAAAAVLAEAERRLRVVAEAGRQTRRQLDGAIRAARKEWRTAIETELREAEGAYEAAIEELAVAADRIALARGGARWLDGVSEGELPLGAAREKLTARIGSGFSPQSYHLAEVLRALAGVVEPKVERSSSRAPARKPRRHKKGMN
jgi:hypothetical protein